jgi:MFS family permease
LPTSDGVAGWSVVNSGVSLADDNVRRFILFRVFFNARFYYPVFGILFLDYGLTIGQLSILNFVWAVAIIGLEVPSGAIADQFGRRPLLIGAAGFMVLELALLAFVPLGNPTILFVAFLINRVLSGAAEASASGADEALVFDSLGAENRTPEWPRVLERLGRWSSFAFLFVMILGGLVYDANLLHRVAGFLGFDVTFNPKTTMRFPIYLTLVNAVCALVVTLRMKEPPRKIENAGPATIAGSFALIRRVVVWLLRSPLVLFLLAAGLLHDSIIRLVMTLGSNYYRLIDIPTAWFGVIGAAFGLFGFFVPTLGRLMVTRRSMAFNFTLLAALTFGGLLGLMLRLPWYGLIFSAILGIVMGLLNFFLSNYLNSLVDSSERATVLSFRGLAFNMGYGLVSVLFAGLMRHLTSTSPAGTSEELIFAASLHWLPWYFLISLFPLAAFARFSGCLRSKPSSSGKICDTEEVKA